MGDLNLSDNEDIATMLAVMTAMANGQFEDAAAIVLGTDLADAHRLLMAAASLLVSAMPAVAAQLGMPFDQFLREAGLVFAGRVTDG